MAQISKVQFFPSKIGGKIKANASVTFDSSLCATGFRIVEGANGLFVGWPSEQGQNNTRYDTFFPLSKELRQEFENVILAEYQKSTEQ